MPRYHGMSFRIKPRMGLFSYVQVVIKVEVIIVAVMHGEPP